VTTTDSDERGERASGDESVRCGASVFDAEVRGEMAALEGALLFGDVVGGVRDVVAVVVVVAAAAAVAVVVVVVGWREAPARRGGGDNRALFRLCFCELRAREYKKCLVRGACWLSVR
jgi:hypothetical protein